MSSEPQTPSSVPEDAADESIATAEPTEGEVESPQESGTEQDAQIPEFEEVNERVVTRLDTNPERLHEVCVPVWAELGRVEMQIGELLQLGEGTVVRLDRTVGDPVDLISQGVTLASGEVIVVGDSFAIRVRHIFSEK